MSGARIHGDDTTVPVLAKMRTTTGRLWTYVRDDRPFGGPAPPSAIFYYSPDREGVHPNRHLAFYAGILQADAYAGYGDLYKAERRPGPIIEAACWSHGRRKFFVLADIAKTAEARAQKKQAAWSPLAHEAVRRIDLIFDAERALNGLVADRRLELRRAHVAPLVAELDDWMRTERAKFSRHSDIAKAMDYMLKRWPAFTRFLDDGRICLTNNAAERALRCVAVGRRNWTFCGSDRGGERAAAIYTLIATAKLNDIDPTGLARQHAGACRITPPSAFTNSCLGIGVLRTSLTPPERNQQSAQGDPTRGRRRMRTASSGSTKKVGRNDPCPCGSGKKYKRCCGLN
jgi:hypothetical protein